MVDMDPPSDQAASPRHNAGAPRAAPDPCSGELPTVAECELLAQFDSFTRGQRVVLTRAVSFASVSLGPGDLGTVVAAPGTAHGDVAQVRADELAERRSVLFNARLGELAPAGLRRQGLWEGARCRIVKDIPFATAGKLQPGDRATILSIPGTHPGEVAQLRADAVRGQGHIVFSALPEEIEVMPPGPPLAKGDRVRLVRGIAFATAGRLEPGDLGTVTLPPGGDCGGYVRADAVRGQKEILFGPKPGEIEPASLGDSPFSVGQLVRVCRPIQFAKAGRLEPGDLAAVCSVPGKAEGEVAQVSAAAVRGQERILFGAREGEIVPVTGDWLVDATRGDLQLAAAIAPDTSHVTPFRRSWSIDECLAQHEDLLKQVDKVRQLGETRLFILRLLLRQELDALAAARAAALDGTQGAAAVAALDAAAAGSATPAAATQAAAERERAARLAGAELRAEMDTVRQHLALAEAARDAASREAADMKQVIDNHKAECPQTLAAHVANTAPRRYYYCSDCKVGGHGRRFCEYLLKRPEWRCYPHQKWGAEKERQPWCPLGMRMVDFCDESYFSRVAMYIRGRAWLEDKQKLHLLVPELQPPTWYVTGKRWFADPGEPPSAGWDPTLPWFLKESDRNFGSSIYIGTSPADCLEHADPTCHYVVQQHIANPLLIDGAKFHVRAYILLLCREDAVTWELHTYRDGYLAISPQKWSHSDRETATQVTIKRNRRCRGWEHWETFYAKYREQMELVVRRAVAGRRLEGERNRKQFEIIAVDVMMDTALNLWLLEFNVSPSLKEPLGSSTDTDAAITTHELDDSQMVASGLHIAIPWDQGSAGDWELVATIAGPEPLSDKQHYSLEAASAAAVCLLRLAATGLQHREPPQWSCPNTVGPATLPRKWDKLSREVVDIAPGDDLSEEAREG